MKLVTRSTCVAVYELLIQLPPIKAWRLPPSKDIIFIVRHLPDVYGMFEPDPHKITISSAKHAHLDTVIRTMAHEMIHLHLYNRKDPLWDKHTKSFLDAAEKVSTTLGFDPKEL
jgi:hypothetical protein